MYAASPGATIFCSPRSYTVSKEIEICCETLCERAVVEEYINFLEIEILDLKKYVAELEEAVQ